MRGLKHVSTIKVAFAGIQGIAMGFRQGEVLEGRGMWRTSMHAEEARVRMAAQVVGSSRERASPRHSSRSRRRGL